MTTHIATLEFIDVFYLNEDNYAYKPHYSHLMSTYKALSFDDAMDKAHNFNAYIKDSCRINLNNNTQND